MHDQLMLPYGRTTGMLVVTGNKKIHDKTYNINNFIYALWVN